MPTPESLLFEDLARTLQYWTDEGTTALSDPESSLLAYESEGAFRHLQSRLSSAEDKRALGLALHEILRGTIHSVLVAIDGGTEMAETQRLHLVTDGGRRLSESLHEEFARFLLRDRSHG